MILLEIDKYINTVKYYEMIISIAGILFGLTFAALTYVLQNGFKSFKYSRIMFLKTYLLFSKIILVSLSYLIIVPFYMIYYSDVIDLTYIIYIIFSIVFLKVVLDYHAYRGYIETLFTHKLIPNHYGKFRRYFRKIINLGFFNVIFLLLQVFFLIIYPIVNSHLLKEEYFSNLTFLVSTGLLLLYCIVSIALFIPSFFKLTIMEYESKKNIDELNKFQEIDIDIDKEYDILIGLFKANGINFDKKPFNILQSEIHYNIKVTEKFEAWFNIVVDYPQGNQFEVRKSIEENALELMKVFNNLDTDINSLVLSYHVNFKNDKKSRGIFLRIRKNEIENILKKRKNPEEALKLVENCLYDDLFYK